MRVLFVSPSAGLGGAERALVEGVRSLRIVAPDWKVALIAAEDGPLVETVRALGAEVDVLPMPGRFAATGEFGHAALGTWIRLASEGGGLMRYARLLRGRFREWRPDVVHSNGLKTHILSAWSAGSDQPLVWHLHDYISARPVSARLLRLHSRKASLVLAVSRSVADDAAGVLGGATRIQTVYNAIDIERFRGEGVRLDLDAASGLPAAPEGTLRVGLAATFARWKGHEVFLRAVGALVARVNIRAYIIGGPVYRTGDASQVRPGELEKLVRDLGLGDRVGFTGMLPDTSVALRALDIVVHASTRPEPFGLTIAEGMATGRAVVMTDAGGAREVAVPDETCLTHAPGDVAALARQIERLVRDPELRGRLGAAAAACVRHRLTHRQMGEALRGAYVGLAGAVEGAA
jgi:glycosyltransferase involved in cell wall biosynthesis